jgi:hypothetical protein
MTLTRQAQNKGRRNNKGKNNDRQKGFLSYCRFIFFADLFINKIVLKRKTAF